MKTQYQTGLIVMLSVAVAVLTWALVYFGKDEWKLASEAPDDNVATRSAARVEDGHAAIELAVAVQKASGIVTAPLKPGRSSASTEVFGTVVNLQPLMESRAHLLSLAGEASSLRASLQALRADHERLRTLYADDRNVSERAVLAAEALLKSEQARLANVDQNTRSQRDSLRLAWGTAVADWAGQPQSRPLQSLLSGQDVLLQFTLPPELVGKARELTLAVPGAAPRIARVVSSAPAADPQFPGATYFYSASASQLRVGMRVSARGRASGQVREGVIIPAAAVVWHAGKAWVYTKGADEDDLFVRREVSVQEDRDDGYFNAVEWGDEEEVVVSGAQLLLSEELKFQIRNENED
jgi:hypothetical protein